MPKSLAVDRVSRVFLLGLLVAVAFGIRLAWGLSRPDTPAQLQALPDQVEYLTLAQNLLREHKLYFIDPRFSAAVYSFRMPGYPLFVAGCGAMVRVVQIAQATLDASTVLAVYVMARLLMPGPRRRAALFAAAMVAVNPLLIYFSATVLSETLFTAMLVWGMVMLLIGLGTSRREGRSPIWLTGAMLLTLGVMVRPSAGLLAVVVGIGAAFANQPSPVAYQALPGPRMLGRWPLPIATTFMLLLGLVLVPWAMRNDRILNRLVITDTNAGITLYDGYNPDANGGSNQKFINMMPQLRLMDECERSQYLAGAAFAFARNHPRRVAELALVKAARTWSPVPLSDQFGTTRNLIALLTYALPLDLLVLLGLRDGGLSRRVKIFLLLPAIYFTIVHALTVGSIRYRVAAEPALAVLAASVFHGRVSSDRSDLEPDLP